MKRSILTIALFFLLGIAALAGPCSLSAQSNRVRINLAHSTLLAPQGWTTLQSGDLVNMVPPQSDGSWEAFVAMEMEGHYTSAKGQRVLQQIESTMDQISKQRELLADQNDSEGFRVIAYRFTHQGTEFRTVFSLVIVNNKLVLCAANCSFDRFEKRIAEFAKAVETISSRQAGLDKVFETIKSPKNEIRAIVVQTLKETRKQEQTSSPLSGVYQCIDEDGTPKPIYYVFNDSEWTQVFDMYSIQKKSSTRSAFQAAENEKPLVVGLTGYRVEGNWIVSDGDRNSFEMTVEADGKRLLKIQLNEGGKISYWKEVRL